jgi:prolyl-tRNA synthetase
MLIRHATPADHGEIMEIYAYARKFMTQHGNPRQWAANGWPPADLIRQDIAEGKCVVVRRDTREKIGCNIADLSETIAKILPAMQKDMYDRAKKHLDEHTFEAPDKETFENLFEETKGFVKAMWCGSRECEEKIKEDYSVTSRCIPYKQEKLSDVCVCCGKPATKMVYWGRAY